MLKINPTILKNPGSYLHKNTSTLVYSNSRFLNLSNTTELLTAISVYRLPSKFDIKLGIKNEILVFLGCQLARNNSFYTFYEDRNSLAFKLFEENQEDIDFFKSNEHMDDFIPSIFFLNPENVSRFLSYETNKTFGELISPINKIFNEMNKTINELNGVKELECIFT